MSICNKEVLINYKDTVFVETGSHTGDTIQLALDCGFKRVISIELSPHYFQYCKNRFSGNNKVSLYFGDSAELLNSVIEDVDERMTFWLDGHYSGGDTAFGKFEFPIIQELETIEKHKIKNNIILIDDIRCWNGGNIQIDEVIFRLKKINSNYIITTLDGYTKNDILLAYTKD